MERSESGKSKSPSERQADVRKILAIFHKWGIHTLGQLAALDKEELAARLGPEAVHMWERANGKSERLLKLVKPPEIFEESFEFEHEIETAQPLLFILRRFLEQLALRLAGVYLVAKELTLRIVFANPPQLRHGTDSSDWRNGSAAADKEIYERLFKIPQPTNDVDLLFRMLGTHLENFRLENPIVAVSLQAQPIKPASQPRMLSGFETTLRNPQKLYETLARLTALLGSDRVGTPILEETHRPDAFRLEPFGSTGFQPVGKAGVPACNTTGRQDARVPHSHDGCAPLPPALRRFRPAVPALMFSSKNLHLQSEKIRGRIAKQRGPYCASGNWWDEKSWEHAEWDVELEGGTVCRCHRSGGTWAIDGIYD